MRVSLTPCFRIYFFRHRSVEQALHWPVGCRLADSTADKLHYHWCSAPSGSSDTLASVFAFTLDGRLLEWVVPTTALSLDAKIMPIVHALPTPTALASAGSSVFLGISSLNELGREGDLVAVLGHVQAASDVGLETTTKSAFSTFAFHQNAASTSSWHHLWTTEPVVDGELRAASLHTSLVATQAALNERQETLILSDLESGDFLGSISTNTPLACECQPKIHRAVLHPTLPFVLVHFKTPRSCTSLDHVDNHSSCAHLYRLSDQAH
ncbi:hypothetical protein CAOG_007391 [Capsaspora owczarzaki ATCC 30864]|uniref:Uncharacterized protein n=1 Tax=Capsaspora owczarzaki (strain ATCC 30864) TaxID=595528 RepID=A0A0D2WXP4_CAPO3|nr:hypothetical protein CAOG_007391 [Capsaspora owczarzaki ATCC 30864]